MKLIFTFLLNLLLFSCNSTIKENYSTDTVVKRVDSGGKVQNFQIKTNSKMEGEEKNIPQENIISVNVEDKIIVVTIKNNFSEEISYDAKIFFERFNYDKWQKIDYVRKYGIPDIEYILKPGETRIHSISFSSFAFPPAKGKYRLIKGYYFGDKIKREEFKEFNID